MVVKNKSKRWIFLNTFNMEHLAKLLLTRPWILNSLMMLFFPLLFFFSVCFIFQIKPWRIFPFVTHMVTDHGNEPTGKKKPCCNLIIMMIINDIFFFFSMEGETFILTQRIFSPHLSAWAFVCSGLLWNHSLHLSLFTASLLLCFNSMNGLCGF